MAVLSTLGALVAWVKAVTLAAIVLKLGVDHLLRSRRTDRILDDEMGVGPEGRPGEDGAETDEEEEEEEGYIVPDGLSGYHGPVAFDGAAVHSVGAFFDTEEGSSGAVVLDDPTTYPESLIMDDGSGLDDAANLDGTAALNGTDLR